VTGDGISAPVSGVTLPPLEPTGQAGEARTRSQERYGRAAKEIAADIARRRTPKEPSKPKKRPRFGGMSWK
jgi:hypothetical protein